MSQSTGAKRAGHILALRRTPVMTPAPPVVAPEPVVTTTLAPRNQQPLGKLLLEDGAVSTGNLLKATVLRKREDVPLGQILLAHGWVTEPALTRALSRQWRTSVIDLLETPPDPRLIDAVGADFCLAQGIVPWRRVAGVTWIATARPQDFDALLPHLPDSFGIVRMLLCAPTQAQEAILATRRTQLIRQAETRVPAAESCRTRNESRTGRIAMGLGAALLAGLLLSPVAVIAALTAWAVLMLICATVLKILAFRSTLRADAAARAEQIALAATLRTPREFDGPLPVISVMVPLFRESDIADSLVARLSRLTYPRELTDILLVVEATDDVTCDALKGVTLPRWMRVVKVPDGPIRTKPRALNYALNFCRGSIVGVWDAEDRPDPDQLHKIARGFHFAAPDVACLQGALDYYNPRTNWMARCFTIEYATLFRVLLPGMARMGLVVPLGGTTQFFRRDVLEQLGAWDAWNVTEDADMGVRLARYGWRAEVLDTTTDEEANCRAVPWVKQRSRWIKGYAMTWGVAMRDPVGLWRQIGTKAFVGMQVQFFGSVSQHLLAPVLWSFWLLSLGLPHPVIPAFPPEWAPLAALSLFALFITAELLNMAIGLYAVRKQKHRHLMPWVPTMHFYNPLACFAGWKAIYEVVVAPFYWDKTTHGIFEAEPQEAANDPAMPGTVAVPMLGQIGGRSLDELAQGQPQAPRSQSTADEPATRQAATA
ncbi:MAG: glycosyltransferase family 2 protein [Paracoccus sp. (in: a-proteobacteria)]|uniref:glycosyltransferase family 2 protein n=1 Tax=Paracoccus sp. TaxID=267 RepID=UPI0026E02E92|nr:glycosyltransferase family 2 protein [Paracoccus sp. (in: a-proteobacteria)]MDO5632186.1 glycosyltransferase family 2 protein [Paracoccus sp. (in: a-proteobacteria)]